eukprot:jgi/Bigna1/86520/estExt_fgenesh1_pg.C_110091
MGLLDVSPIVCSMAGFPNLKGWCRYGLAGLLHVLLAAAATRYLGGKWFIGAAVYVSYQVIDWALHDDDLCLNLMEYALGVALAFLVQTPLIFDRRGMKKD